MKLQKKSLNLQHSIAFEIAVIMMRTRRKAKIPIINGEGHQGVSLLPKRGNCFFDNWVFVVVVLGKVPVKQGVCIEEDKFISNGHLVTGKEMVRQLEMQKES